MESTSSSSFNPLEVSASDMKVEATHDWQKEQLWIANTTIQGGSGLSASVSGLRGNWTPSAMKASLQRFDTCIVPGMFELQQPIQDLSIAYTDEVLDLGELTAFAVCPLMIRSSTAKEKSSQKATTRSDAAPMILPVPVRLKLKYLQLTPKKESNSSLHIASANLLFSRAEHGLTINASGDCKARIVDSATQHWIQASIGPAFGFFDPVASALPSKAHCEYLRIGPSSLGQILLTLPSIEMAEDVVVRCGDVSGAVESQNLVEKLKSLWKDCFPSDVNEPSKLAIRVPKAIINVSSLNATVVGEGIVSASPFQYYTCDRFGVQDTSGRSAAFAGVTANLDPKLCVEISQIDAFYIPGICNMKNQFNKPPEQSFRMGRYVCVQVPPLQLVLLEGAKGKKSESTATKSQPHFELPVPIRCAFQEVTVRYPSLGENSKSRISNLRCVLQASSQPASSVKQTIKFQVAVDLIENKLLKLAKPL